MRDAAGSDEGIWAITDCHPNDVACGGGGGKGAHKLLTSPKTNCKDFCIHQVAQIGWKFCSGELTINGGCTEYKADDTIHFTCE